MKIYKDHQKEQFFLIPPGFYVWFTSRDEALAASIAGEPVETTPHRIWRAQVSEQYYNAIPKEAFPR